MSPIPDLAPRSLRPCGAKCTTLRPLRLCGTVPLAGAQLGLVQLAHGLDRVRLGRWLVVAEADDTGEA